MKGETDTIQTPRSRMSSWIVRTVVYGVTALIITTLTGCTLLIEAPFHFLLGWFMHARKNLPPLIHDWPQLLVPIACLLLSGFLTHRFIHWWLKHQPNSPTWKPVHTCAALSFLLLGSAAAITMSGIAHQFAWLSTEPWLESNRRVRLTHTVSKARQVMLALDDYHAEHGHYPNSLSELQSENEFPPDIFWVETGNRDTLEPFVLLKPGGIRALEPDEAVIVSPILVNEDRLVIGFSDSSVRSRRARELEAILQASPPVPPKPSLPHE